MKLKTSLFVLSALAGWTGGTLFANAFEPNQVLSLSSIEPKLNNRWQKIELPFSSFSKLPMGNVDWFTIEFIGTGPRDFLIDDLQLLGRWKIEME